MLHYRAMAGSILCKMAEDSIADWFRSIPKITRWWFSLCVIIPLLARFGLLNGLWLILMFEPVVYRFQVR